MTCIVAYTDGVRVTMGGDSAGVANHRRDIRLDAKVFHRGPFLMGFTDSFRMGQLLRYGLNVDPRPSAMPPLEYMSTAFVESVRETLRAGGFATVSDNTESGGSFLVGYRGVIYQVEADYQVGVTAQPFAAVGCGEELALGALYATAPLEWSPHQRIRRALDAAATFSGWVAPPYVILRERAYR